MTLMIASVFCTVFWLVCAACEPWRRGGQG
jgi:hypothetical protein